MFSETHGGASSCPCRGRRGRFPEGGKGADSLVDHDGTDTLKGGHGNDTLDAKDRSSGDIVNGGRGVDTCFADPGDTVIGCS